MACVPPAPTPDPAALDALHRLLDGRRIAVLTGAGCSTESGIPDYRGPVTRRRARNPVQYRAFMRDPEARRRYWARAVVGWGRFAGKHPNAAHRALAALEQAGVVRGLVTQNVDRLHQRAGSSAVVELHGALAEVRCTACHHVEPRGAVQRRLLALNPGWTELHAEMAPDGDAELDDDSIAGFAVPACRRCGGVLKPDVVFFGENVPASRVTEAFERVSEAQLLLVLGSSLTVFSGYRFVLSAVERGIDVAIVNRGGTRGDKHALLRVDGHLHQILPLLAERLGCSPCPIV